MLEHLLLVALLAPPHDDVAPVADAPPTIRPTLEEIFAPPRLVGPRPERATISADGSHVAYWHATEDAEKPKPDLFVVPTDGAAAPRRLAVAADEVRAFWTRRGAELLLLRGGWLERLDVAAGGPAEPLLEVGETCSDPVFLEDGVRCVVVAGPTAEAYVVDLATGLRRTPAAGLADRARHFEVLEEAGLLAIFAKPPGAAGEPPPAEATGRVLWLAPLDGGAPPRATSVKDSGRITVSPDGRYAARWRSETERKRELILADYLTPAVTPVPVRGDLAGDPGRRVTLELFDLQEDAPIALPLDAGTHYWHVTVAWAPRGHRLLVHRIGNDFEVRQALVVDPAARTVVPVLSERDEAWVGGPLLHCDWTPDGESVLFTSERSGFNHLYRVAATGGPATCLTDEGAPYEVHELELDARGARLLLVTNDPDPAERHLELLDLASGERRRLTREPGVVSHVAVAADGAAAVFRQERLGVPGELHAVRLVGDGPEPPAPVRLTDTVPAAYRALALPEPKVVEYANPDDGTRVRALLYEPQPFDPQRRYPAVVFVHGAGYLQNVLRSMTSYEPNMLFHHRLARRGYVVLDPDYRHSEGYGRAFRADVAGHMGGKDLDDVVAGVRFLEGLGYVDVARVGIYGGSYGGFLTLMALFTKPDVFACGAALRSVTDWRTYNAWYTNPRLGDPQRHAENYSRSSPIDHAEGLTKPLLLLHGLKDSNVFAQDTIRLMEKLIQLGKDFDAMLYPSQDHGFDDPESWIDEYRRIERFFDRHLRDADAPREG